MYLILESIAHGYDLLRIVRLFKLNNWSYCPSHAVFLIIEPIVIGYSLMHGIEPYPLTMLELS